MIKILPEYSRLKEQQYLNWLSSLNNQEFVLLQQFYPKRKRLSGYPYEFWAYTWVRVHSFKNGMPTQCTGSTINSSNLDHLLEDGIQKILNSPFPNRIVPPQELINPCHKNEEKNEYDAQFVAADYPCFEPSYQGYRISIAERSSNNPDYYREKTGLVSDYPLNYKYQLDNINSVRIIFGAVEEDLKKYLKDFQYFQYCFAERIES